MRPLCLALCCSIAACSPAAPPADPDPACDGKLQPGEGDRVDSVFDVDGDGFVDAAAPGCAEVFAPTSLDCDDADPQVFPGADEVPCNDVDDDCNPDTADSVDADADGFTSCDDCDDGNAARNADVAEVCWNDVDDDCDGEVDPGCGPDYNGTFRLDQRLSYRCALGYVDIDFDHLDLIWDPPEATSYPLSGASPALLSGTIEADGTFVLEQAVVIGTVAACDEYYRLSGRFDGPDRFTALFEAVFVGAACLNCQDQSVPDLIGERTIETSTAP